MPGLQCVHYTVRQTGGVNQSVRYIEAGAACMPALLHCRRRDKEQTKLRSPSPWKKLTDEIYDQSAVGEAAGGMPKEGHPVRRFVDQQAWRRRAEEDDLVAGVGVGVTEAKDRGVLGLHRIGEAGEEQRDLQANDYVLHCSLS